jgi:hypothetical protein
MEMSDETAFSLKSRYAEVFKLSGTVPPEPLCNEGAEPYRARALSYAQLLLPKEHPWTNIPLRHAPLDVAEHALIDERSAELKRPVGPLRAVTDTDRTGRAITKFYGDPEHTWAPFKGPHQRLVGINSELGTGENSPHAVAERKAAAQELQLAYAALDEKRAAAGLR